MQLCGHMSPASPLRIAAHTPVRKSHTRTTACLPSCALASTVPSASKPNAHTCEEWPKKNLERMEHQVQQGRGM